METFFGLFGPPLRRTKSGMNRWGVRTFFLSAGEKFGAGRKIDINNSTPMVYDRMLELNLPSGGSFRHYRKI